MFEQPWAFISNNRGVYRGSQSIRAFQVYGLSNRSITFQVDSFSLDFFPLPFSFLFFFFFFFTSGKKGSIVRLEATERSVSQRANGSKRFANVNRHKLASVSSMHRDVMKSLLRVRDSAYTEWSNYWRYTVGNYRFQNTRNCVNNNYSNTDDMLMDDDTLMIQYLLTND